MTKLANYLTQEAINTKIDTFLSTLETDYTSVSDYINAEDIDDFSEAYNTIYAKIEENNGLDVEIIYYSNAMDYLSKNDNSLNCSLEIAAELGFNIENLNSELLASLLASQENRENFTELEDEIDTFFSELEDEIDTYKNDVINLLINEGKYTADLEYLELNELTKFAKSNEL